MSIGPYILGLLGAGVLIAVVWLGERKLFRSPNRRRNSIVLFTACAILFSLPAGYLWFESTLTTLQKLQYSAISMVIVLPCVVTAIGVARYWRPFLEQGQGETEGSIHAANLKPFLELIAVSVGYHLLPEEVTSIQASLENTRLNSSCLQIDWSGRRTKLKLSLELDEDRPGLIILCLELYPPLPIIWDRILTIMHFCDLYELKSLSDEPSTVPNISPEN